MLAGDGEKASPRSLGGLIIKAYLKHIVEFPKQELQYHAVIRAPLTHSSFFQIEDHI